MIYLLVFILLAFFCIRYDFTDLNKKNANFWYKFSCLVLIAVAGLRYKVGGDTLSYMEYFKDIPYLWDLQKFDFAQAHYDPLWVIFSSISKSIFNDFTFFQILHATFINIIIFRFIRQNTAFRFTAALIYYLFFYINFNTEILREALAICMFLLGYSALKEKKWLKFYAYAFLAFLFHVSALILFIIPLLRNIKFKLITVLPLVALFFLIVFSQDSLKLLLSLFLFNDRISERFVTYSVLKLNGNGMFVEFIIYFLFPALIVYMNHRIWRRKIAFQELYFTYFFLTVIIIGFSGFSRFVNYLTPFMIVYFANTLNWIYRYRIIRPFKRLTVTCLLVIAFVPKIIYYFNDTSSIVRGTHRYNTYYPYDSVFDKEENQKREDLYYGLFNLN